MLTHVGNFTFWIGKWRGFDTDVGEHSRQWMGTGNEACHVRCCMNDMKMIWIRTTPADWNCCGWAVITMYFDTHTSKRPEQWKPYFKGYHA